MPLHTAPVPPALDISLTLKTTAATTTTTTKLASPSTPKEAQNIVKSVVVDKKEIAGDDPNDSGQEPVRRRSRRSSTSTGNHRRRRSRLTSSDTQTTIALDEQHVHVKDEHVSPTAATAAVKRRASTTSNNNGSVEKPSSLSPSSSVKKKRTSAARKMVTVEDEEDAESLVSEDGLDSSTLGCATEDTTGQTVNVAEGPLETTQASDDEERRHLEAFERKMRFFKESRMEPSASIEDLPQLDDNGPSNATVQLSATLAPCVLQMQTVIKTVSFIVANQNRVKRLDASVVLDLLTILNRLLEAHERFQQVCLNGGEEATLKALYCLLNETMADHQDLAQRWAITYHSIQEVGQALAAKLSTSNKTNLFSLFKNKTAEQLTPEECEHWIEALGQAANDWQVMMDNMVPQWKAYKHYARQMHRFAIVVETESIGEFVDGFLRQAYKEARTIFRNSIKLSQLHHQIDYSALHKEIPKENAGMPVVLLDDEDDSNDQAANPSSSSQASDEPVSRYLFAYDVLKMRRHIHHATLTEHAPLPAVAPSVQGKKGASAHQQQQPQSQEMVLVLTSDLVYIGSRSASGGATEGKNAPEGGVAPKMTTAAANTATNSPGTIRLLHEPVNLADTQITCPPDAPGNENVVIVCFHNTTTYILQAKTSQERDTWMRVARQFSLDRPRPSVGLLQDNDMLINASTTSLASMHQASGSGNGTGNSVRSLFQRIKSARRSGGGGGGGGGLLTISSTGSLNELAQSDGKRREELGIRRLPADRGTILPVPLHIHLRASVMVERNVQMVDLTTGKTTTCEFGLARENYQVNDHVDAGFLMVTLPAVKATQAEYFAANGQGLVAAPYDLNEPSTYYHPLKPEDIFVSTWIHPDLGIQFQPDMVTVSLANMYKFIFDSPETVARLQGHYHKLLQEQVQAPDNLFLTMPFRSQAVQVAKRMSRGFTTTTTAAAAAVAMHERLEMGRCYIEFRQMSNHPSALSVGFWNPKTRRDMALGVCPLNLSQINNSTSTWTGSNAKPGSNTSSTSPTTPTSARSIATPTGAWNATTGMTTSTSTTTTGAVKMQQLVTRDTPTELQFRLVRTDVTVNRRPQNSNNNNNKAVPLTSKDSSTLDTYYIRGTREALNEFEEFLRQCLGVVCTSPSIEETLLLAQVAFDQQNIDSFEVYSVGLESGEESPSDLPSHGHVAKLIKNLNLAHGSGGQSSLRSMVSRSSKASSKTLAPVAEELENESVVHPRMRTESNREVAEEEKKEEEEEEDSNDEYEDEEEDDDDEDEDEDDDEEEEDDDDEEEDMEEEDSEDEAQQGWGEGLEEDDSGDGPLERASSAGTFKCKDPEALKRMAEEAEANDQMENHSQDPEGLGAVLQIDDSSFGDLTADTLLSSFFNTPEEGCSPLLAKAAELQIPIQNNHGASTMAPPTSGYVEVDGFKLRRQSKSHLPGQQQRTSQSSANSSTLSIRPSYRRPQRQQGSSDSFHEPKSVADLARFWSDTTAATTTTATTATATTAMSSNLRLTSHHLIAKKRTESSATLVSPRTATSTTATITTNMATELRGSGLTKKGDSKSSLFGPVRQASGMSHKTASILSMATEAVHGGGYYGQSQSKLLRQSQKWEGGVESVPHQPVRELKAHWESLHKEGM